MSKRPAQDASESVSARKTAARNRSRRDRSRAFRIRFFEISLCERPKQNAPGVESEGVRVPRRSGRPISWQRISRVCGNLSRHAVVRRRTAARTMPHRAGGVRVRTGWGCGWRVSWLKSLDSSGETDAEDCDGRARYTRRFANANIFFTNASAADERLCGMRHDRLRIPCGMHSLWTKIQGDGIVALYAARSQRRITASALYRRHGSRRCSDRRWRC